MVKVLIVEDNQAVRESTRLVLDGAGHEVLEAVSGLRMNNAYVRPGGVAQDVLPEHLTH